MKLHFIHFHYSAGIKNFFSLHKSFPSTNGHDLVSPTLWEILGQFVSVFRRVSVLPFCFCPAVRKAHFVQKSFLKRGILKFCCVLFMAYAFVTFLLLTHQLLFSSSSMDARRMFSMFYIICLFPIFIPISFVIAFRAEPICPTINPINLFQQRIAGNIDGLSFECFQFDFVFQVSLKRYFV